jgi:hypothetical protein
MIHADAPQHGVIDVLAPGARGHGLRFPSANVLVLHAFFHRSTSGKINPG